MLLAKGGGDWIAPVATECAMRNTNTNRRLSTLVFVDLDQPCDALHISAFETCRKDVLDTAILFHV